MDSLGLMSGQYSITDMGASSAEQAIAVPGSRSANPTP
ncbi:hypothetical protein N599_11085 [Saccharopolyspora erythraea D]|nr:hypothetical protein N599_11085 [Saccharopolyspora erythraea D]